MKLWRISSAGIWTHDLLIKINNQSALSNIVLGVSFKILGKNDLSFGSTKWQWYAVNI